MIRQLHTHLPSLAITPLTTAARGTKVPLSHNSPKRPTREVYHFTAFSLFTFHNPLTGSRQICFTFPYQIFGVYFLICVVVMSARVVSFLGAETSGW